MGLELKVSDDGSGFIEGYGSVFGNVDSYGDVVARGAFTRSIEGFRNGSAPWPAMLLQHGGPRTTDKMPIGIWTDISEDSYGLRMRGQLALRTQRGADTYALLKMKPWPALDGLSIGYVAKDWTTNPHGSNARRILKDVDLKECSIVTFPANRSATITGVKGIQVFAGRQQLYDDGLDTVQGKLCDYMYPYFNGSGYSAIARGAFADWLDRKQIAKVLLDHDDLEIVNADMELFDTDDALFFRCPLLGNAESQLAKQRLKTAIYQDMSVGLKYRASAVTRRRVGNFDVSIITRADLDEASIVHEGAIRTARAILVDSSKRDTLEREAKSNRVLSDDSYLAFQKSMDAFRQTLSCAA